MRLSSNDKNVGGQSLLPQKDAIFRADPSDKYLVETIWFDDLVDYLPKRKNGKDFEEAIIKIDIEGFEPLAFTHASNLFRKVQINIVYMEFVKVFNDKVEPRLLQNMFEFLTNHKLTPYDYRGTKLKVEEWKTWHTILNSTEFNMIWKRDGF